MQQQAESTIANSEHSGSATEQIDNFFDSDDAAQIEAMKQKLEWPKSTIKRHEEEEEMMPVKGAIVVGMQPNQSQTT